MDEQADQPSPVVEGGCDEHSAPRDVRKQKSSKCMCGHTHADWSKIPTYAEWLTRHPELTKNVASAQQPASAENIAVSFCVSISVNMQHRLTILCPLLFSLSLQALCKVSNLQKILFLKEVMSTDKQEQEDTPMSGSITKDDCTDDIQVLSSEVIVMEDSGGDDVARAELKLTQPKFLRKMGTVPKISIKPLPQRNSDKTS